MRAATPVCGAVGDAEPGRDPPAWGFFDAFSLDTVTGHLSVTGEATTPLASPRPVSLGRGPDVRGQAQGCFVLVSSFPPDRSGVKALVIAYVALVKFIELMQKSVFTATSGLVLAGGLLVAGPSVAAADEDKDTNGCVALSSEANAEEYTEGDAKAAEELNDELSEDMAGNMDGHRASCARAVVETAQERGLDQRAASIAMATVIVETHLENLTGGDRDSVGLYQQRDHYGSAKDRLDPGTATDAFFEELERVHPNGSWDTEAMGEVAQDVQRSAYPDRYGHQIDDAEIIVDHFW